MGWESFGVLYRSFFALISPPQASSELSDEEVPNLSDELEETEANEWYAILQTPSNLANLNWKFHSVRINPEDQCQLRFRFPKSLPQQSASLIL